jgi:hypothetical protein
MVEPVEFIGVDISMSEAKGAWAKRKNFLPRITPILQINVAESGFFNHEGSKKRSPQSLLNSWCPLFLCD